MRRWIGLVVAAALALSTGLPPAIAIAAPANAPALSPYSERSRQLVDLTTEASAASESLGTWLGFGKLPPDEMLAFLDREMPNLELARAKLRAVKAKLDALPPFRGSPEEARIVAVLEEDSRAYVTGMDGVLGAVEELLRAVRAGDEAKAAAAAPKVARVTIVLADGQIAMVKGRQALFPKDTGGYFVMGIMGALYDGMKAALTVSLQQVEPADAAREMRAAAKRCRENVAAGKPVAERAFTTASPADKAFYQLDRDQLAVGAEIATALEQSADIMDRATDPMDAFRATMTMLTELEARIIDIATRQGALI